jgi:hypothetical protein
VQGLIRDVWTERIAPERMLALRRAASAQEALPEESSTPDELGLGAPPSIAEVGSAERGLKLTSGSGGGIAIQPFEPAYRAIGCGGASTAEPSGTWLGDAAGSYIGSAVRVMRALCVLVRVTRLTQHRVCLAQVEMLPSARTVATVVRGRPASGTADQLPVNSSLCVHGGLGWAWQVSVAGSLGSGAAGAAELVAGAAIGAAGTVASSTLGAPGQVAMAVAGAAVSAAGTATRAGIGAVTTAANLVRPTCLHLHLADFRTCTCTLVTDPHGGAHRR